MHRNPNRTERTAFSRGTEQPWTMDIRMYVPTTFGRSRALPAGNTEMKTETENGEMYGRLPNLQYSTYISSLLDYLPALRWTCPST